tara:strand:- start:1956 stop:2171 length:216 start_codon:yes stop_codon:yes gene_type:complete
MKFTPMSLDNKKEDQIYDFIVFNKIATEDEIVLVTNINGYNIETLNNIIYAKIGYHDMNQVLECEPKKYKK